MQRKIFFITLLMHAVICLPAQKPDSLITVYNNQTIYRYGNSFLKGSEKLTYKELEKEFSMSDLGLEAYRQSKKHLKISIIFSLFSLASGITSFAMIAGNNAGNRTTAVIFLGGQFAFSLGAGRYRTLSQQSLDRAIWQRNKDLLFSNQ